MHSSPPVARRQPAITEVINQWQAGSPAAGDRVLPHLYQRMRAIAAHHLRGERVGHTLQATALVHEAILRLRTTRRNHWRSRLQFMAFAARLMRQILVDHARTRGRLKRGGDVQRVPLDQVGENLAMYVETEPGIVALDDALAALARWHPEHARTVELRYFGGLTSVEIAQATQVSVSTVERRWRYARAWLYQRLTDGTS